MAQRVQIAIDCVDPYLLSQFWAAVLDYEVMDPPPGYTSWQEHARAQAEEPGEAWVRIGDPDGHGPRLMFHRVPEAKVVKNRVHLDVRAPEVGFDERRRQVDAFIDRIVGLGGSKAHDV